MTKKQSVKKSVRRMPIKAQRVLLRMYSFEELDKMFPMQGKWNIDKTSYENCCNDISHPDDRNRTYWCTIAVDHYGPHIAHCEYSGAVAAWTTDLKRSKMIAKYAR